jgi:hypothetical protein
MPDLYALAKELTPTNGAYQNTLQKVVRKDLIPWLGTIDALRFIRPTTNLTRLGMQTSTFPLSTQVSPIPIPLSKFTDIL